MGQFLKAFAKNESGATAIEYGLIAAGIAVAIATIVTSLGTDITEAFTTVDTKIKAANAAP